MLHTLRSEYYSVWSKFNFKVDKNENHFGPSELHVLMGVSATLLWVLALMSAKLKPPTHIFNYKAACADYKKINEYSA